MAEHNPHDLGRTRPAPIDLPPTQAEVETPGHAPGASRPTPTVPGYEVLGVLGQGGMGVVYRARQVALNRPVALKMILTGAHAGAHERARFRAEAETIARLSHPNIVQIFEVGEHDGCPYLALELVEGGSLQNCLRGQPLAPTAAAGLLREVARAVAYAHDKGVVHRDLKPANVLLVVSRDTERGPEATALRSASRLTDVTPKLTDFGLARRLGEQGLTGSGAILGTPSYMAPEQAMGQKDVGPAADVYALGAMLYECLTGKPPFSGTTMMETLQQVCADEPVPPRLFQPGTPAELEAICLKCLEKAPEHRYPSALAVADDLGRFLDGEPVLARSANLLERVTRLLNRNEFASPVADFLSGWHFRLAPLPFLLQLALYLGAGGRPYYPWAALVVAVLTPVLVFVALRQLERSRPRSLPSATLRQIWSSRAAHFGGMLLLLLVSYLTAPPDRPYDPLTVFPLWAVLAGVTFVNLGAQFWGRLYLLGVGLFAAAVAMCLRLEWAPLVVGLTMSAILTSMALHLRKIARA